MVEKSSKVAEEGNEITSPIQPNSDISYTVVTIHADKTPKQGGVKSRFENGSASTLLAKMGDSDGKGTELKNFSIEETQVLRSAGYQNEESGFTPKHAKCTFTKVENIQAEEFAVSS